MPHKNSNQSMVPNHLYEIIDKEDEDTFDIPGKKEARRLEKRHIKEYEKLHGRKPKGNLRY